MNIHYKLRLAVSIGLLLLVNPATYAQTFSVNSNIEAVTVFPDRALVQRTSESTSIPAGTSTLIISQLPIHILEDSLRVDGSGSGELTITSVELLRIPMQQLTHDKERQLNHQLTKLTDQKKAHQFQIKTLQARLQFIDAIGKDLPNTVNQEIVRGMINPQTWEQAWQTLEFGTHSAYEGIQNAEIQMRELERQIQQIKAQLSAIHTGGKEDIQAHITVEAPHDTQLTLQLFYQVFGASWTPLYDARLHTQSATLTLSQLAQVRQNTGEDWPHTTLTLSTARPAQGGQMPTLTPWWIQFQSADFEQDLAQPMKHRKTQPNAGAMQEMARLQSMPASPKEAMPARVRMANVLSSEFATEYKIPGRAQVPADQASHKFAIQDYHLDSQLTVKSTPKLAPIAYLYATSTFKAEAPLLSGKVALYRDGAFISNTTIDAITPGQELSLSFGLDEKVIIDYKQLKGKQGEQGIINKDRHTERQYKITVTNHHNRNLPITIMEQLPVAQHEDIQVALLKSSTPPTTTDVDDNKGVVAWTQDYSPNKKREILFGYSVTYPLDQRVSGF